MIVCNVLADNLQLADGHDLSLALRNPLLRGLNGVNTEQAEHGIAKNISQQHSAGETCKNST